jgi:hypothetical protein
MTQSPEQWLGFDALSVAMGQELQIYPDPEDKSHFHRGILAGVLPDEALLITHCEPNDVPDMESGQRIVVRINLPVGVAIFPATVMFITHQPRLIIYVDFPSAVKFRQVRGALRVNVTLPVIGSNLDRPTIYGVPGKIKDLSETGAKIAMFQELATNNERIQLKGKFEVGGVARTLTVQGMVRSESAEADEVMYGVEFMHANDDQKLVLSNFIFHAMAFGSVQLIQ